MAIPLYLAMTGAEFSRCSQLPARMAWMACHFSSYGTGLSNFPTSLPPNSMIIVNDRTPIHGHDPGLIASQLNDLHEKLHPDRVLLDLQRPGCKDTAQLVDVLVRSLRCPVGVSELYAGDLPCPVFLPPAKLNRFLKDHLAPWEGREIWLEASLDSMCFTVTEKGCSAEPYPAKEQHDFPFQSQEHHCRYRISSSDNAVCFHLCRTKSDLDALLADAEKLGVTTAVGLYQELK